MPKCSDNLIFSAAVKAALSEGRPVLALESTVITHGLPYPRNLEIARMLEKTAVDNGATPATIAVIDGKIHIGLDDKNFSKLAELSRRNESEPGLLKKIALRDIPLACAEQWSGGTTVSATVYAAYLSGISVFATGGIGGVHRGWQEIFDISADLPALAKYPVIVVTAGCKAILDIPTTLEVLETLAVPVYGWKTDFCPAFYTSSTGFQIDRIDDVKTLVTAYKKHLELSSLSNEPIPASGMVLMNPIPAAFSLPVNEIEPIIERALSEAAQLKIKGKAITPWLLKHLSETTAGKSVAANLELLRNNVVLGSKVAVALQN